MAASSSSSTGGEQQYSLRWNDFQSSILSSVRQLRDVEDFVDVTLACDSCSFTAHKIVLSACSPYFRNLLKANPCPHPIVILKDVASSDMESLLRFMYHGEVHVGQEQLPAFLKTAQMLQVRGLADVNSGATKIPSSSAGNNGSAPATPRNWQDNGRGDLNESELSPPEKRARSYSPPIGNHVEPKLDLQESLLGQALEGGPTIHTTSTNNIQAQSTGEDSNSMSENEEDVSNHGSILNAVKTEPSDILNDSIEHHRNSFPAALLSLQGMNMPGPSGMHQVANQDPNYDHGLDEAEGAAYHHHHSHHQQHHRHRHHHPLSVPPPHHRHQAQLEDDTSVNQSSTTATTITRTIKYERGQPDFRQQRLLREHHRQHGYRCPLCCRTLHDISAMRAHLDHHYPRDSPTCPVSSCAKTFSHPNSVRNHMRLKHPVEWDQIKTLRWTYV
ncbi:PREDICTED: protein bric-a-brac 2-like isoform X2 [Cyphomyrmex costatus]|uniref:protein bric-a-brac 2-like isoform X2 n=1 Tax=Cyphomyrmex costatus TaxID=456900 RepID=UPI0008523330|nr:PREDICTED: protein bric-a-brac 2-like isoform X2 [Cyphomyrmex costatus]